jgi:hypothetical protein
MVLILFQDGRFRFQVHLAPLQASSLALDSRVLARAAKVEP